ADARDLLADGLSAPAHGLPESLSRLGGLLGRLTGLAEATDDGWEDLGGVLGVLRGLAALAALAATEDGATAESSQDRELLGHLADDVAQAPQRRGDPEGVARDRPVQPLEHVGQPIRQPAQGRRARPR